jgi:excisionase family DNA binding protein
MESPSLPALTLSQVAGRLQISTSQVVTLIDAGKLRAFNTGTKTRRELRIKPEWIDNFVEQSTVEPPRKMTRPKEAKREVLVRRFLKGVV